MVADGFCVTDLLVIRAVLAGAGATNESLVHAAERSALQTALANPLQQTIISKVRGLL